MCEAACVGRVGGPGHGFYWCQQDSPQPTVQLGDLRWEHPPPQAQGRAWPSRASWRPPCASLGLLVSAACCLCEARQLPGTPGAQAGRGGGSPGEAKARPVGLNGEEAGAPARSVLADCCARLTDSALRAQVGEGPGGHGAAVRVACGVTEPSPRALPLGA